MGVWSLYLIWGSKPWNTGEDPAYRASSASMRSSCCWGCWPDELSVVLKRATATRQTQLRHSLSVVLKLFKLIPINRLDDSLLGVFTKVLLIKITSIRVPRPFLTALGWLQWKYLSLTFWFVELQNEFFSPLFLRHYMETHVHPHALLTPHRLLAHTHTHTHCLLLQQPHDCANTSKCHEVKKIKRKGASSPPVLTTLLQVASWAQRGAFI